MGGHLRDTQSRMLPDTGGFASISGFSVVGSAECESIAGLAVATDRVVGMGRYAPTAVILAVSIAASVAAIVLGGPRTGYLPGFVISTIIVVAITWRYRPSQYTVWSAAVLLAAYHLGGTLMVGSDVLAHVSIGNSVLRYDRGLHVFGAIVVVLLIAESWHRSRHVAYGSILALGLATGFAVEGMEVFFALAAPSVFSYDLHDSSLDVAANIVGAVSAITVLVWTRRTEARKWYGPAA